MTLAIETTGLTKTYNGRTRALDGVDLQVRPGEVFAFLGPNGSGKTTLMRILTTQFRPTSGEARAFGLDVVRRGGEVRRMIGYVPQETSVWLDITGRENLLIYSKIYGVPRSHRKERIGDAIQAMGLEEVADRMVKTYSGGWSGGSRSPPPSSSNLRSSSSTSRRSASTPRRGRRSGRA